MKWFNRKERKVDRVSKIFTINHLKAYDDKKVYAKSDENGNLLIPMSVAEGVEGYFHGNTTYLLQIDKSLILNVVEKALEEEGYELTLTKIGDKLENG